MNEKKRSNRVQVKKKGKICQCRDGSSVDPMGSTEPTEFRKKTMKNSRKMK